MPKLYQIFYTRHNGQDDCIMMAAETAPDLEAAGRYITEYYRYDEPEHYGPSAIADIIPVNYAFTPEHKRYRVILEEDK